MILYHATKEREAFESILQCKRLIPGRNVTTDTVVGVHLSRNPFYPGSWALDVIGADTNEAWVFEIEIPDDATLIPDPSGEGAFYNGEWVVHEGTLNITICSITYIADVPAWERGDTKAAIPVSHN